MLEIIIQSLVNRYDKNSIIVATTKNKIDNKIQKLCEDLSILYYRGEEENVASRFRTILNDDNSIKHFFRVCADGPLINLSGMEKSLKIIKNNDFVTSIPNKGFPMGANIELFKKHIFLNHYDFFYKKSHFEHVTRYFYEKIESFNHLFISTNNFSFNYNETKFSVDFKEDLDKMRKIFKNYPKINLLSVEEQIKIYNSL